MTKLTLTFLGRLLLCLGMLAPTNSRGASPEAASEQLRSEQKHFVECLACVYSPAFWFSYNDSLYFQPQNETQLRQLETMKAARSQYQVLTNLQTRHDLAAKLIAASGIDQAWQKKILLPFSTTNQNLTPTLEKPLQIIPKYKVLQLLAQADALIQDDQATYFVMNFGRGADDAARTNALLIKEGRKAFATSEGFKNIDAFADASLNAEEKAILNRVVAACQNQTAALAPKLAESKARQDFEDNLARATDSNPYMEFLLAKCYLEGKGTDRDEKLGWEWMNRAAKNGSGDAISYLAAAGRKAP
jgi:TPR repeat protein